jgi:hypothetical protein
LREAALPETGQPPDALLRRRLQTIRLPREKMGPDPLRSVQNKGVGSKACNGHFAVRASRISSPAKVIVRELFDGLVWNPVTSVDGVFVLVAGVGGVS